MRDARYVRLISWTLQSGSKHAYSRVQSIYTSNIHRAQSHECRVYRKQCLECRAKTHILECRVYTYFDVDPRVQNLECRANNRLPTVLKIEATLKCTICYGWQKSLIFRKIGGLFKWSIFYEIVFLCVKTLPAAFCHLQEENRQPLRTVLSFSSFSFCMGVRGSG